MRQTGCSARSFAATAFFVLCIFVTSGGTNELHAANGSVSDKLIVLFRQLVFGEDSADNAKALHTLLSRREKRLEIGIYGGITKSQGTIIDSRASEYSQASGLMFGFLTSGSPSDLLAIGHHDDESLNSFLRSVISRVTGTGEAQAILSLRSFAKFNCWVVNSYSDPARLILHTSIMFIDGGLSDADFDSCILRNFAVGLGLTGYISPNRYAFDTSNQLPGESDYITLTRLLYDPNLKIGMKKQETLDIVSKLIDEMIGKGK